MSRALTFFLVVITLGLALLLAWLGLATVPSNWLGWFLLITGLVYFFGVLIVYWFRRIQFWKPRAKGETVKEERNDRSFWLIAAGMIAAFYVPPGEYLLLESVLPRVVSMQIIGLFLIVLGSILFVWARRTLGHFYSGHVSVIEGQRLVQDGPYRFIRHPAYAGYLLLALGEALGYSSAIGLLAILGLLLPSLLYRINVEEKLLSAHFGEAHQRYASRTRRWLPGIW
jgi:protein-S-isoprenylcysteine O-methyltransferase Ste14